MKLEACVLSVRASGAVAGMRSYSSATGSCPPLVVFCALVPLFPNLQLLCAKTSVLPVDMREHRCKPCNTKGLYYTRARLPNALSIIDIFSFSFCFLCLLAFWTS